MIDFPIVDTHVHLLDTKKFKYSWAAGAPKLGRDWSAERPDGRLPDLMRSRRSSLWKSTSTCRNISMRRSGYSRCLRRTRASRAASRACRWNGRIPRTRNGAAGQISRSCGACAASSRTSQTPTLCSSPISSSAIKLLPKYNLSFDICIFHHQLPNTLELVRRCPEVSFVLDHIAKPGIKAGLVEPWAAAHPRDGGASRMSSASYRASPPRPTTKTGRANSSAPTSTTSSSSFGFNRIMYGGDWPVSELAGRYTDWLEVLDWATTGCTPEEKRKLFRDNGIAAYRLA